MARPPPTGGHGKTLTLVHVLPLDTRARDAAADEDAAVASIAGGPPPLPIDAVEQVVVPVARRTAVLRLHGGRRRRRLGRRTPWHLPGGFPPFHAHRLRHESTGVPAIIAQTRVAHNRRNNHHHHPPPTSVSEGLTAIPSPCGGCCEPVRGMSLTVECLSNALLPPPGKLSADTLTLGRVRGACIRCPPPSGVHSAAP